MANPLDLLKGVVGGIKVVAQGAKKVKAMQEAADDDLDGDGIPELTELKTQFPLLLADGKAFALRVKDFGLAAYAYFMHVLNADDK